MDDTVKFHDEGLISCEIILYEPIQSEGEF